MGQEIKLPIEYRLCYELTNLPGGHAFRLKVGGDLFDSICVLRAVSFFFHQVSRSVPGRIDNISGDQSGA